ncbi:nucleotide-diphospho-sugar transferase [Peziza echinospora]|nr:nucleotide-diphospho-sugar transferase [Peziza echinospora]
MYELKGAAATAPGELYQKLIAFCSGRRRLVVLLLTGGIVLITIFSTFALSESPPTSAIGRDIAQQQAILKLQETGQEISALSCPPANTSPPSPSPTPYPPLPEITPQFAYMFYATSYEYACSVLVNIDRLLHHPTIRSKDARIGVYLSTGLRQADRVEYDLLNDAFEKLHQSTSGRVFIVRADPPQTLIEPMLHYKNVLLKLVPFDIATRSASSLSNLYIPAYHFKTDEIKRMIILDSDQLIMRNLDHLFYLPPVEIAAPKMYWGDGGGITTTLMVVQPSISLWKRMDKAIHTIRAGEYDMDLVNRVFKKEIMALPGRYCTLNSHWEVNDVPEWYHHDAPAHPLPASATKFQQLEMMNTNYTTLQKGNGSGTWADDPAVGLLNDAEVVHFTALGKPWTWSTANGIVNKPKSHWIFIEMFGEWRSAALKVCPGWSDRGDYINVKKRGLAHP